MKLYPLTLSTERDRERECPKHTRLSTSYLNWHRRSVWRASALNTNKEKKLNERNYEKNEKIRRSVVFAEKFDVGGHFFSTSPNFRKKDWITFDDLQKWQSLRNILLFFCKFWMIFDIVDKVQVILILPLPTFYQCSSKFNINCLV